MKYNDIIIYQQYKGKMKKINHTQFADRSRFVILWRGLDWSGFRTLNQCVEQFRELERREDAHLDDFQVVER